MCLVLVFFGGKIINNEIFQAGPIFHTGADEKQIINFHWPFKVINLTVFIPCSCSWATSVLDEFEADAILWTICIERVQWLLTGQVN